MITKNVHFTFNSLTVNVYLLLPNHVIIYIV